MPWRSSLQNIPRQKAAGVEYPPAPWKYDIKENWIHGVDMKQANNAPAVKMQKMKFGWKGVAPGEGEIVKPVKFKAGKIDKTVRCCYERPRSIPSSTRSW